MSKIIFHLPLTVFAIGDRGEYGSTGDDILFITLLGSTPGAPRRCDWPFAAEIAPPAKEELRGIILRNTPVKIDY